MLTLINKYCIEEEIVSICNINMINKYKLLTIYYDLSVFIRYYIDTVVTVTDEPSMI